MAYPVQLLSFNQLWILLGIDGVVCYLDNILIKGISMAQFVQRTRIVLSCLNRHNVRLRLDKCIWFASELEYLGFVICSEGRKPCPSLVRDILNCKIPSTVKEVRSFLGLINFYSEFLPRFSTVAKPLRRLTEDDVDFVWSSECQQSFELCKKLLSSNELLIHYNPDLPIVVITDASPVGVGAVLAHVVKHNGQSLERLVMFASASPNKTQQNYAQVDREALAVIFAVTKFYKFLWGRSFTIVTDNSAIQRILSPEKGLPVRTGHQLQHWAAILQGYNYKIVHRKADLMSVPDALSRLPCSISIDHLSYVPKNVLALPITVDKIAEATRSDPVLSKVLYITHIGWPNNNSY